MMTRRRAVRSRSEMEKRSRIHLFSVNGHSGPPPIQNKGGMERNIRGIDWLGQRLRGCHFTLSVMCHKLSVDICPSINGPIFHMQPAAKFTGVPTKGERARANPSFSVRKVIYNFSPIARERAAERETANEQEDLLYYEVNLTSLHYYMVVLT